MTEENRKYIIERFMDGQSVHFLATCYNLSSKDIEDAIRAEIERREKR